ncbi:MAG: uroporphyrinogen-III C-methyltransferase [Acidimicrobiales bacterium]|jgi:uroporphyrin-III C-methyltransferase
MTVYLVGAGPGDPQLITVRGARLLASADVVVHDRLAVPVLSLAREGAELIDVGKTRGMAPVPQDEINAILVEQGRRRGCVVRLKGGDPFVFARGAEEAAALLGAGISFEVVPGVSSVLAAPAAARIPLTLRGVAQSFTVLTGHEDPACVPEERWHAIAGLAGTILVLMGSARIGAIAERLVGSGLAPQTPVAAVYAAATEVQQISVSSLDGIGAGHYAAPTTFVIGEVVRHRLGT